MKFGENKRRLDALIEAVFKFYEEHLKRCRANEEEDESCDRIFEEHSLKSSASNFRRRDPAGNKRKISASSESHQRCKFRWPMKVYLCRC